MTKVTHYCSCERGHEGDTMDYWDDKTVCGLEQVENVSDKWAQVDCKKCLSKKEAYQKAEREENVFARFSF